MNNLSRRSLIRGAAVLPATGLGLVSTADASSSSKPKFDEIYDVVIIGSGFSGLAAALAAREAGASAAVFEKMAFVGGNSSLSGGMFAVPGSSVQKEQGIKDSPEALMADMERIGLGLGDPQHIRFVCEHAAETFEWTRSYIGVDWNPTLTGKGGHSAERCLITRQGTGQGIIVPAVKKLASLGVKPRTGCFMEKILRSPEGRVQGVEIREGYVFGKPAAGTVKRIGARRAVVLACGGFGADVKYRQKLDPKLGAQFLTTNQPGATSESWREVSRIGARIIQADWIQCLPSCSPLEKGMGKATHFASISGSLFGFWLSSLTGERFVNEFGDRKVCTDAILTVSQRGTTARLVSRFHPGTPIIACLLDQQVRRQMALYWGVEPIMMPYASSTDELVDFAVQAAAQAGVVHEGDLVVVTAGVPVGVAGTTNMIRIQQVGGALVNAVGIGEKKASGPLCICRSTDEVAEKFQPGDVLVVPYTTNKLLPYIRQAAAVITEEASVECHTATIGLALDKPVIVGAAGAVQRLTDGTMVTVDCARGLVRAMP